MYSIPSQNNKTPFKSLKLPTTLQECVRTYFPPTVEQPSDYKYPMPPVYVALVLNQQHHFTLQHFELPKTDCPNLSA